MNDKTELELLMNECRDREARLRDPKALYYEEKDIAQKLFTEPVWRSIADEAITYLEEEIACGCEAARQAKLHLEPCNRCRCLERIERLAREARKKVG